MSGFASRTAVVVAVLAAAMSVICTFFVSYGQPWPSLAFAVLACAAVVWLGSFRVRPVPRRSRVNRDVEAESPRVPATPERGVV